MQQATHCLKWADKKTLDSSGRWCTGSITVRDYDHGKSVTLLFLVCAAADVSAYVLLRYPDATAKHSCG